MSHIHADVRARHESGQPRYTGPRHPRPYHPKSGVIDQVRFRIAVNVVVHDHLLAIAGHANLRDLADFHVFVADFRLVPFHPFGIGKANVDRRTLRQLLVNDHEAADQDHDGREDPDQRQAAPKGAGGHGRRKIIEIPLSPLAHGVVSHSSRSSKVRAANSVRTTTAAKASAPQPTATYARLLICTSAASSEMA